MIGFRVAVEMTECRAKYIRRDLNRVLGGEAGKAGAAQSSWGLHGPTMHADPNQLL